MKVVVTIYDEDNEDRCAAVGEYDVQCIMPLAEKSSGIAWISFRGPAGEADLAIEAGFHVEKDGSYLKVLPDVAEEVD